jgi:hypothetical protein
MASLTLLWSDATDAEQVVLRDAAAAENAEMRRVEPQDVVRAIVAALPRGGVVYVAPGVREASHALGVGVDEVVRAGHVSAPHVTRALQQAAIRSAARAKRDELALRGPQDVGPVLALLSTVLGHEVNTPLSIAALNCDALERCIDPLLDAQERLLGWAMLSAPQDELRRLVQRIGRQPGPAELRAIVEDLRTGIDRVIHSTRLLLRLSSEEETAQVATARGAIRDLHDLFRGQLSTRIDFSVEVEAPCLVRIARPTLVFLVAALLAHALDAVRESGPERGCITLRASQHEDAVLVEVEHDGAAIPADLRPSMMKPYFALPSGFAAEVSIEGLQRRVRSLGGELLVLSDGTTTLRLVLPPAETSLGSDLATTAGEDEAGLTNRRAQ